MLRTRTPTGGWRYALIGAVASALMLAAWLGLEFQRLRANHTWPIAAPARLAGASFALVCNLVGPSLSAIGAAFIPTALAAIAPCLLQLSIVLVTVVAGALAPDPRSADRPALGRAGLRFAAGFLGVYAVAALALGLTGAALSSYAFVLRALGGALVLLLGLAMLRVLRVGMLSSCRRPRWLIITGRASLRRPLGASVAFAIYCVGCCGPYLGGLALLGAGSGGGWQGAMLTGGFALAMAAVLLLPIFALPAS